MKPIAPDRLRAVLRDGREYALLDVRERGNYAASHLFTAINLPLSRLELGMRQYVPRPDTRVLLCDDDDGFAERAGAIMEAAGYTDVYRVEGGIRNCTAAGFQLFRGHYTLPYAFGLHIDRQYRPVAVTPENLADSMESERAPVVIDTRTWEEFSEASVPGAVNVPLGELIYRIRDVVPDTSTPVVITCGAVTRGILGAASLIEAGVGNSVSVLSNGLRGWDHADFASAPGTKRMAPEVSTEGTAFARGVVRRGAAATGVRHISQKTLQQWRSDTRRTVYIIDVRTREEYESGHLFDSIWVPGGELIGLYEDHIGTMNARVCLVDNDGVRAGFVAGWLNRMGWPDVAVLGGGTEGQELVTGDRSDVVPEIERLDVELLHPADLEQLVERENILILDVADSLTHERAHIPDAWWTPRSQLPNLACKLPASDRLVVTSPDGRLAILTAGDLTVLTDKPVVALRGGTEAWRASGRKLDAGLTRTLGEVDDVAAEFTARSGDPPEAIRTARGRMLEWQADLLDVLDRDTTFAFPDIGKYPEPRRLP